jgi:hypothetical protein
MRKKRMSFDETCRLLRERHGDGCWPWPGHVDRDGYGIASVPRSPPWYKGTAHRAVYLYLVGPLPKGVQLAACSALRSCVNPAHCRPETFREVIRRGNSAGGRNGRKTACKRGHPFTPENTDRMKDGSRRCKACRHGRTPRRARTGQSVFA